MNKIYINTDGGSRGNPGPAAIGVVFSDEKGQVFHNYKECIGITTNNEAEYRAIIKALEILSKSSWLKENNSKEHKVVCRLDSQLVVEQLNGNYKIKQEHIRRFVDQIFQITKEFKIDLSFVHVPREENKLADKLVNEALDEETSSKQQTDNR
ncbi:MAG: ribonuclease HI family protein [Patescibacteria group bacterium]|nr:ribonuclease HI family protein [Patescibacteria group bacterium]